MVVVKLSCSVGIVLKGFPVLLLLLNLAIQSSCFEHEKFLDIPFGTWNLAKPSSEQQFEFRIYDHLNFHHK